MTIKQDHLDDALVLVESNLGRLTMGIPRPVPEWTQKRFDMIVRTAMRAAERRAGNQRKPLRRKV